MTRRSLLMAGLALSASVVAAPAGAYVSQRVESVAAYRQALAQAAMYHRFVLVDIRADWCAVCLRIEREILPHAEVQRYLEHVALIKVDVTAMDEDNRRLLAHLDASGPPIFFIAEAATGEEYQGTRSLGSFTRSNLIRRLEPFARS